eukprot:scaffold4740_cov165-Amphora_coffeaeformis.AAC.12
MINQVDSRSVGVDHHIRPFGLHAIVDVKLFASVYFGKNGSIGKDLQRCGCQNRIFGKIALGKEPPACTVNGRLFDFNMINAPAILGQVLNFSLRFKEWVAFEFPIAVVNGQFLARLNGGRCL